MAAAKSSQTGKPLEREIVRAFALHAQTHAARPHTGAAGPARRNRRRAMRRARADAAPPPFVGRAGQAGSDSSRRSPLAEKVRHHRKTVQRRTTRYRWYVVGILTAVVCSVTVVETQQYRTSKVWGSELFRLEEVRIEGNERITTDEVVEALGIEVGRTTMHDVVPDTLGARLRATFADVQEVVVRREMPGTVRVRVVERRPMARIRNGGAMLVVDRDGVVLARPFVTPRGQQAAVGNAGVAPDRAIAEQIRALPLIVGVPAPSSKPGTQLEAEAVRLALDVIHANSAMALSAVAGDEHAMLGAPGSSDAGHATRTASGSPSTSAAPPPRLAAKPLAIERVDARSPHRIVVRFRPYAHRGAIAWFSEENLEQGLKNFYRVFVSRLFTHPAVPRLSSPTAGAASGPPHASPTGGETSPEPSPSVGNAESSQTPLSSALPHAQESSPLQPESSPTLSSSPNRPLVVPEEERYDARSNSTLYVTSVSGGHNG
jgi:cell division protein FtsQ